MTKRSCPHGVTRTDSGEGNVAAKSLLSLSPFYKEGGRDLTPTRFKNETLYLVNKAYIYIQPSEATLCVR